MKEKAKKSTRFMKENFSQESDFSQVINIFPSFC